jgi:hypothetical protein
LLFSLPVMTLPLVKVLQMRLVYLVRLRVLLLACLALRLKVRLVCLLRRLVCHRSWRN